MDFRLKGTDFDAEPVEVFARLLRQHEQCFLLESLGDEDESHGSSQSYIGVAPKHHYAARDGQLYVDGRLTETDNPYQTLQSQFKIRRGSLSHYAGGLVGYLAHEAMQYSEPMLSFAYPRKFFDFEFGEYEDGLIFKPGQTPQYFHYGTDRLALYRGAITEPSELKIEFVQAAKTEREYSDMVKQARRDIENGRVFQAVLANKYEYHFVGDLFELYKQLRQINPSPFMFFMKFGDRVTLGASPELLAHTTPDGMTHLEALAGTIRRGRTPEEDAALADQLSRDEKEIAEHNMLVDLARNDVGRISRIGSVEVDKLLYIKQLSHVQHLCSLVSGQLSPNCNAFDALAAAFPAGTLVGAPKVEAAKMIRQLEGYERGPYGGTIGYFSYSGDSMHAVNIRSVQATGSRLYLHTGSGIIYDSQPEREYQEISDKKAAMDAAMEPFLKAGSV